MVATAVTLNDLEGHSPLVDVFECNPSNICAAFYTISTDRVLVWFLCISKASCQYFSHKTAIIFQLTKRVTRFLCTSRASCKRCCSTIKRFSLIFLVFDDVLQVKLSKLVAHCQHSSACCIFACRIVASRVMDKK